MGRGEGFLIDASAAVRIARPESLAAWSDALAAGRIGICGPTRQELLYSSRSFAEFEAKRRGFDKTFTWWPMPDSIESDCDRLQGDLAKIGAHRSASVIDLMVSVIARHHGLAVLHYDRDFETIARITGQPTRWLAEPGSIP